jgi:predicted metal-dependent hydrolase
MASKIYEIDGIGKITVYKRRKTKRISMRLVGREIRVVQPVWLPYITGYKFVLSNISWVKDQQKIKPNANISDGTIIGKSRVLRFIDNSPKLTSRINATHIFIYLPKGINEPDTDAQVTAIKAIKRALKKEASELLPIRVSKIAQQTGLDYGKLSYKSMRSRWGSCTNKKDISLNIYLLMMPYELIDYVILHELTHTKHLNHGKDFWKALESHMPDYKNRRKQLKELQPNILAIQ